MKMEQDLSANMKTMEELLSPDTSFDLVYRTIDIGGTKSCLYFVDGFCKDELLQKILQYLMDKKPEDIPETAHAMSKKFLPYVEVDLGEDFQVMIKNLLSGQAVLMMDGFSQCLMIDSRTYPARTVTEPEKEKSLRGSKDGFVETLIFNTALIRRRIRSPKLRMEILSAGEVSQTDICLCYMDDRVDHKLLCQVRNRIRNMHVDALTMNQESLAECLFCGKWYNPFPKFKYTERPDTASAHVLEGNLIVLVDNSPAAMILPTTIYDILEEADDYYFPPITGTYLRLSRALIAIVTYLLTPTFLLLMKHQGMLPDWISFIQLQDEVHVPIILQFLILEVALDGLKLAAVNTPNMLSMPLSVTAGIIMGEFAVKSGWFNSEVMLYMAFVAIANYTLTNYEMGYALKFMRILTLILTWLLDIYGYILGIAVVILFVALNKTITGKNYLSGVKKGELWKRFVRMRL